MFACDNVQVAGAWVATRINGRGPRPDDDDEVELEGTISAFTSRTSFSVNGIPVDASERRVRRRHGRPGARRPGRGARAAPVNGVVIATRVKVEDEEDHRGEGFELHGAITAIDTTAKTFMLREVKVSYAGPGIEYRDGSEALLAVGVRLEVKGRLSAEGTTLRAERISFGD